MNRTDTQSDRRILSRAALGLAAGKGLRIIGHRKGRRSFRIIGWIVSGYSLLAIGGIAILRFGDRQEAKEIRKRLEREVHSTADLSARRARTPSRA